MKTIPSLVIAGIACILPAIAAESAQPAVTLTVKKHLVDSDSDLRGLRGSSKQKTITLRVEIVNTSRKTIESAGISGFALVKRAGDFNEKLLKESLGSAKVPALKPNGKATIELGKIDLRELEWKARKFEESLEEWKVTCNDAGIEIGSAVSGKNYDSLEKEAVRPAGNPGRKKQRAAR